MAMRRGRAGGSGLLLLPVIVAAAGHAGTVQGGPAGPVASFSVDVRGGNAVFEVAYREDCIGLMGVGGMIAIDCDLDIGTPNRYWRGYDAQLRYDASTLAPACSITFYGGPHDGKTIDVGQGSGQFACSSRSVAIAVPLDLISAGGDFSCVLLSTGATSFGPVEQRLPAAGVLRASSGQVEGIAVAGDTSAHTITSPAGSEGVVSRVTTGIDGENAVWIIDSNVDLPTDPLDFAKMLSLRLLIDTDRKLATGLEGANLPFVPFGPDLSVRCTLAPGGNAIEVVDRYIVAEAHVATIGGPAVSDLAIDNNGRQARITVPMHVLGIASTDFDWVLLAGKDGKLATFGGAAFNFGSATANAPLKLPADAIAVDDPKDALAVAGVAGPDTMPNVDIARLAAGISGELLMVQLTYQKPIEPADNYFTDIRLRIPGGAPELWKVGINWSYGLGGQVWLAAVRPEGEPEPIPIHQAAASRGREVYLMVPLSLLGPQPVRSLQMFVVTRFVGSRLDAGSPDSIAVIDQVPDAGFVVVGEGAGVVKPDPAPAPGPPAAPIQPAGQPQPQPANPWGQWKPVAP